MGVGAGVVVVVVVVVGGGTLAPTTTTQWKFRRTPAVWTVIRTDQRFVAVALLTRTLPLCAKSLPAQRYVPRKMTPRPAANAQRLWVGMFRTRTTKVPPELGKRTELIVAVITWYVRR